MPTLHELLIVAALAALLAILALSSRGGEPQRSAAALARDLRAARTHAVVAGAFTPALGRCATDPFTPLTPSVRVAVPTRGLAFDPQGRPRACDGSAVGNATIVLRTQGREAAVVIASLGRIRWERR